MLDPIGMQPLMMTANPRTAHRKKLIEVALPLDAINIASARENARQVREQTGSAMWEQLNRLFLAVRGAAGEDQWESDPHAKSIRNTFSIPIGDICVSCFQPCSEYAGKLDVCTEELTGRDAKSHPETKAVNATYCSCAL